MDYQTIILKKEEGVAIITLNRPERLNALTPKMLEEIITVTREVGEDEGIRAMVVTGAGRAFCAGADLDSPIFSMTNPAEIKEAVQPFSQIVFGLRNLPKPVIASVNGVAAGGGCGIAFACDIIIASDRARFGLAFTNVGLHPNTGCAYFLPRLAGVAKACELIFTSDIIDAREAERIGLVNKVVPAEELEAKTREIALKIAQGPPIAISMAKASIYKSLAMDLPSVLDMEERAQAICILTQDAKEGIRAFLEKRKPLFKGK